VGSPILHDHGAVRAVPVALGDLIVAGAEGMHACLAAIANHDDFLSMVALADGAQVRVGGRFILFVGLVVFIISSAFRVLGSPFSSVEFGDLVLVFAFESSTFGI
jgi:hypothetical protein